MTEWTISPTHFVERHGLVIIVALGESIVAIGVGAVALPVNAELIMVVALGLALVYLLWWTYFGGDDEAAERALASLPPQRRAGWRFVPSATRTCRSCSASWCSPMA
jgi:low temperature requirement protein LtrA